MDVIIEFFEDDDCIKRAQFKSPINSAIKGWQRENWDGAPASISSIFVGHRYISNFSQ